MLGCRACDKRDHVGRMIAARLSGLGAPLAGSPPTAMQLWANNWRKIKAAGPAQIRNVATPPIKTPEDYLRAGVMRSDWKMVADWYAYTINERMKTSIDPAKYWDLCTLNLGQYRVEPFTLSDLYSFIILVDRQFAINDLGHEMGLGTNIDPNDDLKFGGWLFFLSGNGGAISIDDSINSIARGNNRMALGWVKEPSKHLANRIILSIGLAIVGGAALNAALAAGAQAVGASTAATAGGTTGFSTGAATGGITGGTAGGLTTAQAVTAAVQAGIKNVAMNQIQDAAMSTFTIRPALATVASAAQSQAIIGISNPTPSAPTMTTSVTPATLDALKQQVQAGLNAGIWPGAKKNFSIDGALFGGCKGCKGATLDSIVQTAVKGGEQNPDRILSAWVAAVNATWGVKWLVPANAQAREILLGLINYFIAKYAPPPAPVVAPIAPIAPTVTTVVPTASTPVIAPSVTTPAPVPVVGTTPAGSPVVAVDQTGNLISALIAQGQSQQQAFAQAMASLAANGVQPTQQVQAQVAQDVQQASATQAGGASGWMQYAALAAAGVGALFLLAHPSKRRS